MREIAVERRVRSAPIIKELFGYLEKLWFEQMLDSTSLLGKAVSYSLQRKDSLSRFLEHPEIPLSNNHVERAIRPVALGRKNWLFFWTEVGAKYAAIAYTLIESCKMADVKPWEYMIDVMQRIDTHLARDVHELTPKLWKQNFAEK